MKKSESLIRNEPITDIIHEMRGVRVILDSDLARIYGVPTKRLNQQMTRNRDRFPADFAFQLTVSEYRRLKLQFATSNTRRGGKRKLPSVFTEHGALMAANVLKSKRASAMSVFVVRAFMKMREALMTTQTLAAKLDVLERRLTNRLDVHEKAITEILDEIRRLMAPPPARRKKIGF